MRGYELPPGGSVNLFSAALLAVLGVGAIIFGLVDRGDDAVSESAANAATAFAVVFGLLMLVLAYIVFRRSVPRGTSDFSLTATPAAVERGGTVTLTLAIPDTTKVGPELELGLVCTEYYDVEVSRPTGNSTSRGPETREAVAHEEWRPADPSAVHQSQAFSIPAGAPFTHHGKCLHYEWRAVAREPERLRPDSRSDQVVTVEP